MIFKNLGDSRSHWVYRKSPPSYGRLNRLMRRARGDKVGKWSRTRGRRWNTVPQRNRCPVHNSQKGIPRNDFAKVLLHTLELISPQSGNTKPWKWVPFGMWSLSKARHRKWALLKMSFPDGVKWWKYTFWKVIIFDGAAENRKMKRRWAESRIRAFLQIHLILCFAAW